MTLTRTLIPGGDWIYARASVSGTHWQTTMSSPADPVNSGSARNVTVIDFQQESTTTKNFYETQRLAYQGTTSGTLLQTTVTCYNGNTANCNTTAVTLPISRRTVFVQLPNAAGLQSRADSFYDTSSGMLTEVDQYGYGSGAPGSLLRKTTITYASLGNNILNRPSSVLVQDNSSPAKTLSQTTYTYDEGTPTATTGTPQHVAVTGSRGNATTITTSVGGSSLTRHLTYYDTGNVNQSTDVNGAVTTYNYASGNPSCSNSFPTSITLPISGLSQSMSWNCTGAVQTSATDANGNTTHTNFTTDTKFWRPESLQDAAGNVTALTYTGQTQVEAALSFNGGNSAVDALSVLDGLSRASVRQQRQAPGTSNFDSAQQTYDALGRPNKGTMPYLGTSIGQGNPQGTPATTATYDALWRPLTVTDGGGGSVTYTYTKNDVLQVIGPQPAGEHTKNKQLEYDALGRLISVCEVTTGGVSGACNQQNAQNGYLTTYVYDNPTINSVVYNRTIVTQNAQTGGTPQTRTLQYDLLGRLVSEANPESGTASYVYDTDATCGTSKGDLVKRTDAAGNVTCYSYDSLHRKTLIAYPSGPNASVSHEKVFYYDTSYSQPTVNVKGRLAAAGTCLHSNDCAGNWQTLEEFSYSPRGETTDVYERTPNSGGVYHVTASYWAHGLLKSLSGVPSVPTLYYGANDGSGLDGEGRLTKVTASSGQNPVTGITYTNSGTAQPIGSLTQLTFGSADFDNFSYDVNTGRMSQYQFHVASQTDTGTLTRNANGTLQQLAITDQINTSNSQTCTFGHDDLARIASVSCGTTWSQTFSFDPFGNISKSGSITFLPTYNLATNRFQTIPGGTPTYDANGNLTYDLSHNYSWDAEGKALTIDSVGLTYDALGRMVEQARGSSYTEIVYGPSGSKLALMNGQTLSKAFMPLPSGATAVYTASGLAYYRHADWLGSARLASTPSRGVYFDGAYAPYGEDYAKSGTTDLNFTGQNQDTVSGLYDFMYREYHAVQGRWISPDPAGLGAVSPASPQSWNRYAYVSNNPLSFIDPLGLFQCAGATCPPPPHPTDPSPYLDEWWGWGSGSPTDGPLSMIFRGGQKGGGTSSCTITVTIFNSANLSQEQFSAIEQQISDLFSAPGIAPGGLGVTFEEGNVAAPHQLNLSGGFGPSLWEDNWGVGKGPPLFPTAQVFLAKIAFDMTPEGYPMSLEQMFGTVGAHELAHDYLPDSPRPTSPTDIMGVGFMSFAEMSSALGTNQLGFTFSEASRMFQGCMSTQAP
jgi:RHS repeat-associated protein